MSTNKRFSPWYLVILALALILVWLAMGFLARAVD